MIQKAASTTAGGKPYISLEPLKTPRIIVGWDNDWLEATPCSLRFWEKLSLEPYARPKHISYVAFVPQSKDHHLQAACFFRELSAYYEVSLA
jgi:mediator of RNA polymerase II transcription subunit 13